LALAGAWATRASWALRTLWATTIAARATGATCIGAAWAATVARRTITRGTITRRTALAIAARAGTTVAAWAITALAVTSRVTTATTEITTTVMAPIAALLRRRHVLELFTGLGQQRRQGLNGDALERAEVGFGQLGVLEITQQGQTLAALTLFLFAALVLLGAAAGEFVQRHLAVLVGELARGLAVQVKALLATRHGDQVRGRTRVAAKECRQGRLAELTGRALLDVDLDAQLQGLGLALEQTWEEFGQASGRLGRGLASGLGASLGRCGIG
jgi:hypothetical protein